MRKLHYIALFWLMIFGVILIIPNLGLVGSPNEVSDDEKRKKAEFPVVQFDSITAFTKGVNDYYADRFWGRDHFIQGTAKIKYHLFNTSASEKMVVGKEGYLFFNENDMAKDYRGACEMDPDSIKWLFNQVDDFKNAFADSVDFVWLIAPNKNSIYPEYLPNRVMPTEFPDRLKQLKSFAQTSEFDFFLDPSDFLKEHKKDSLYFKEDTHWNYKGAKLTLQAVIDKLDIQLRIAEIDWQQDTRIGDLASLSGLDHFEEYFSHPATLNDESIIVENDLPDGWEHYKNSHALNDMTVLLMGDSFGMYLRDWLKISCSELIVVPNWVVRTEVIEKVEPDLVIYEMVERNIPSLFEIFSHP